jgi:hypothetical protein
MNIAPSTQATIIDGAHQARQSGLPKLNPYAVSSPEHASYEVGWTGLHLITAQVPSDNANAFSEQINKTLGFPSPDAGTKSNGWFGGYGCRWCSASQAWFTTLPFDALAIAYTLAELFNEAGCKTVTVTNSGGVSKADGGVGVQVSARI